MNYGTIYQIALLAWEACGSMFFILLIYIYIFTTIVQHNEEWATVICAVKIIIHTWHEYTEYADFNNHRGTHFA